MLSNIGILLKLMQKYVPHLWVMIVLKLLIVLLHLGHTRKAGLITSKSLSQDMKTFPRATKSCFDANVQAISLSMIPNLYRGHTCTSIPFNFTHASRLLVILRGLIFPLLYMSNFYTIMVIILAILMFILLSYLPSDLQRSPTYYYSYIVLPSFRGLPLITL